MPPPWPPSAANAATGDSRPAAMKMARRILPPPSLASAEQDQEADQQRIERHRLGQRKPKNADAKHLGPGGGVARNAADQCSEDVPDADTGTGDTDGSKTGSDTRSQSMRCLRIHVRIPLLWFSADARRRAGRGRSERRTR